MTYFQGFSVANVIRKSSFFTLIDSCTVLSFVSIQKWAKWQNVLLKSVDIYTHGNIQQLYQIRIK